MVDPYAAMPSKYEFDCGTYARVPGTKRYVRVKGPKLSYRLARLFKPRDRLAAA